MTAPSLFGLLRPPAGEFCRSGSPCSPHAGAPPCTRVTFPSRGKSPKAHQGLRPLESPKGDAIAPPAASRNPLDGGSATAKDRFATLRWWANRSLFLPSFLQGKFFAVNPWLGRVLVARLGATFGGIRGIGEGGFWKRTGNEVAETEGREGD